MKSTRLLAVLLLSGSPLLAAPAATIDASPPLSRWAPENTMFALELFAPGEVIKPLLDPQTRDRIAALPVYQQFRARPQFAEFQAFLGYLEFSLGTDWQSALRELTDGGLILAAAPRNHFAFVLEAGGEERLRKLHKFLQQIAESEAEKAGQPGRVRSEPIDNGITGWRFNEREVHALVRNRLVMADSEAHLRLHIKRGESGIGRSLWTSERYQSARASLGSDAVGMVFADLQTLRQRPQFAHALQGPTGNPLLALLVADLLDRFHAADWAAIGLYLRDNTLEARLVVADTVPDATSPSAFALSDSGPLGALANLQVPRQIAALSLYRDLHRFYAAKDDLFPERTSGLIFFENMMGIFFSGRDLTEDVLAHFEPELRVVVAEQKYDPEVGTPDPQLPGFAAVFRVQDAEHFGEVMEEAWQKAIGLVNFTRGQQAEPGMIIDRPQHAGHTFTVARFSSLGVTDPAHLHTRYNFRPSLARPGDYVILSSTDELAKNLIDVLSRNPNDEPGPRIEHHSSLKISGQQLASILNSNRESMIRQNMIKEGHTQEEAEMAIGALLALVDTVQEASLNVGSLGEEATNPASLKIRFGLSH